MITREKLIKDWENLYAKEGKNRVKKTSDYWPESKIIDENQSVKWNKEQVIKHNEDVEEKFRFECIKLREERRKLQFITFEYFRDEVCCDNRLTQAMFNIAWAKGYEEGHSEGIYRILDEVEEYLDFFFEMLNQYELSCI